MRGHHHRSTSLQGLLYGRNRSTNTRIFGDVAVCILRHVEISTDENALALQRALGDQVTQSLKLHVLSCQKFERNRYFTVQSQAKPSSHCMHTQCKTILGENVCLHQPLALSTDGITQSSEANCLKEVPLIPGYLTSSQI